MSADTDTNTPEQDELTALKARADLLKIPYHPSIGVEKLREKVANAINGTEPVTAGADPAPTPTPVNTGAETDGQRRARLRREANALVRIRVTCMNPAKKDWEGEIFATGNALVGSIKKYVPFNVDAGWHVPNMIYEMLQARQCQVFTTVKSARGVDIRQGKLIKEFAIEVMDPLTKDELQELAQRQALARSID